MIPKRVPFFFILCPPVENPPAIAIRVTCRSKELGGHVSGSGGSEGRPTVFLLRACTVSVTCVPRLLSRRFSRAGLLRQMPTPSLLIYGFRCITYYDCDNMEDDTKEVGSLPLA